MKKFSLPKDGGLIEAGLPNGVKHTYERIPAHIYEDEELAKEEEPTTKTSKFGPLKFGEDYDIKRDGQYSRKKR